MVEVGEVQVFVGSEKERRGLAVDPRAQGNQANDSMVE